MQTQSRGNNDKKKMIKSDQERIALSRGEENFHVSSFAPAYKFDFKDIIRRAFESSSEIVNYRTYRF